jgi:hypothetical protein
MLEQESAGQSMLEHLPGQSMLEYSVGAEPVLEEEQLAESQQSAGCLPPVN